MQRLDRQTATALLVAATLFMEVLDSTIITTALPIIAKDFGVDWQGSGDDGGVQHLHK